MRLHTRTRPKSRHSVILFVTVALLVVSACGGGGTDGPEGASVETPQGNGGRVVPTMPSAQFAQPTTMIDATKVAETAATPEPEQAVDLEFGGQIYGRQCADCHGETLEGAAGKAEPIAVYELDKGALTDLLRTGGGYGPEHLFGLDKVSPEGITALQAYMQTLLESE